MITIGVNVGQYSLNDLAKLMSKSDQTKYVTVASILHIAKTNNDEDSSSETLYIDSDVSQIIGRIKETIGLDSDTDFESDSMSEVSVDLSSPGSVSLSFETDGDEHENVDIEVYSSSDRIQALCDILRAAGARYDDPSRDGSSVPDE